MARSEYLNLVYLQDESYHSNANHSTVAVALWALNNTAVSPSLELVVDDVLDGGVGPIATNNPAWEPRS